jgi:hypothetical protein
MVAGCRSRMADYHTTGPSSIVLIRTYTSTAAVEADSDSGLKREAEAPPEEEVVLVRIVQDRPHHPQSGRNLSGAHRYLIARKDLWTYGGTDRCDRGNIYWTRNDINNDTWNRRNIERLHEWNHECSTHES